MNKKSGRIELYKYLQIKVPLGPGTVLNTGHSRLAGNVGACQGGAGRAQPVDGVEAFSVVSHLAGAVAAG